MNKDQFTKKLESLQTFPLECTETLISQIIQLVEAAGDELPAVNWGLFKIAQTVTKTKQVEPVEKIVHYQTLMKYVVETALKFELEAGTQALRWLFDSSSEFYKRNLHDNSVEFPLSRQRPLKRYMPVVGEECDIVRPCLTTTSRMGWTRCKVLSISNAGVYTVKFINSNDTNILHDGFWFAPFGTRTQDFNWRQNLQVGDLVDALDNKNVWFLSTISEVQIEQNTGIKNLRISFRYYDQKGDRTDSEGKVFFGWGNNEDQWADYTNPRIQRPGKMRKNLCYYASTTHNEFYIDDSYDIVYQKQFQEKPFYAMLRSAFTRCQVIYSLFNLFVEQGGIQKQIKMLKSGQSSKIDAICFSSLATALASFMPPRMVTKQLYSEYLQLLIEYVTKNFKLMNNQRLQMIFYCLQCLGKRTMTLCQKHDMIDNLKKALLPKFLLSNLQKQLIGLQFIYNLIKPMRPHTQQSQKQFLTYLTTNNIFYLLYKQNESHEQVQYRSTQFLEYMLKNKIISLKQIDYLWNLYPLNDVKNRVTLQKLIGDVIHEMDLEQIAYLLGKLLQIQPQDFILDHLQLLNIMKTKNKLEGQAYTRALDLLWQLLTVKSASVKPAVEAEVEKIFKSFITNIEDEKVKFQLLNSMLSCLKQTTNIQKQPSFLKQYLLSFETKTPLIQIQSQYPKTRQDVVTYLLKNDIYDICLQHISRTKVQHKIQEVLSLLKQIIKQAPHNSKIGRDVYQILGPSEFNLKWLASLTFQLSELIEQLFSLIQLEPFKDITLTGLNSLIHMFNQINSFKNKRKYVKQKLQIAENFDIELQTFVLTMCRPDELIGINFLNNLLQVVKNPLVSSKLVEFITQINVHLDQNLFGQVELIRKQFLSNIIKYFQSVNQLPEITEVTMHQLASKINILNEYIDETSVSGLKGIRPYFQTLKGDQINLKIQNNISGTKKPKEVEIFVSDNIIFQELKEVVAQKLEHDKYDISLYKGKRCYEEKNNGKSLSDLKISKGDSIKVERAKIPEALKAPLLNDQKTGLSLKMKQVSTRIYSIYADLDKGTTLSKANFFKLCADIAKANGKDDEAKKMNDQDNQHNKDIKFNQEDLEKQFFERIKNKQQHIWKFIQSIGLQQQLKTQHKQSSKDLPISAMPRHILSNNTVYSILLSMLQNPKLQKYHTLIFKLLCSLPIDDKLKQQVFGDWSPQRINRKRSVYEINYLLGIVESQLLKEGNELCYNFNQMGTTLIKYLKDYEFQHKDNSIYNLAGMQKIVIGDILRILAGFVRIQKQPNAVASKMYYEIINQVELSQFIELLEKKPDLNQHDVEYKQKFQQRKIVVPLDQVSSIASSILYNLIENYSDSYIRCITPEAARISLMVIQSYPHNIKILIDSLKLDSLNLRRTGCNLLYYQCTFNNEFLASTLNFILQNIPSENKNTYMQYFDLFSKLTELSVKRQANTINFKVLAQELLNRILNYKSQEKRTAVSSDKIMVGLLSVIQSILVSKPQVAASLTSYKWKLLHRSLFYPNPSQKIQNLQIPSDQINNANQPEFFDDYINSKSVSTRKALIKVLIQLIKYHEQNQPDFFEQLIDPIIKQLPQKYRKPSQKGTLVGIQNLGGICYLSSMCQALNSVSAFRNGISMVSQTNSKLIWATQRMLAYLFFSQRQDYTPTSFLQSFIQPINPNLQQDTTQFLNLYFDQLQSQLQTTPYRSLLRQLFQGSTIVQMICHNCKHKRERTQEYYCYSVGLRQKPTLEIALQGMHEGDIINDFFCQKCEIKSDLTKRSVLGQLPNFLFLHLQRIVNLDFYRYTKIHSKCLFPLELNIEPYTKQGVELRQQFGVEYLKKLEQNEEQLNKFKLRAKHEKPDRHYIYNLKAIIVHSGSAEGGHYYTILRREKGWIKLDDSKVSFFSLQQFQAQCYGGPFNVIGEWGIQQSKNAYVLLYQKQLKQPIHLDFTNNQQQASKFDINLQTALKGIDYDNFKPFNATDLYKQVWMDNHNLMLQTHIFGEGNNKNFINLVEKAAQYSNSQRKAELIAQVLFKISTSSNEFGTLIIEFQKCNPGYEIFLKYAKDFDNMLNLIFHGEKSIRASVSKFLTILVLNSIKEGPAEEVYKLLDLFINKLNTQVAKNWLRVQNYFQFLENIVTKSVEYPQLYKYIINKHLISILIDFILEKQSPLKISLKKHSMGNKFNRVEFEGGVRIIAWLLQRSYYFNGKNQQIVIGQKFHLSDNDILVLSSMNFYGKMIKEGQAIHIIGGIIQKLSFDNYGFTQAISRTLLRIVNDSMQRLSESVCAISVIEKVLLIEDSIWKKKAQFILGVGQPYRVNPDNTFAFIDIDRFSFNSTLQDIFPIQCIFNLAFISRARYPEVTVYLINSMLKIALKSSSNLQYFLVQPAPNYLLSTYVDWWDQFLSHAFGIISTKTIKQQQLNRLKIQTTQLLQTFKSKVNQNYDIKLITGKIIKPKNRKIKKHGDIGISLVIEDLDVYTIPSQPSNDRQTNNSLQKYLTYNKLEDADDSIAADSNILYFMTTSKPALAITQNEKVETSSNKAQTSQVKHQQIKNNQVHFDADKQGGNNMQSQDFNDFVEEHSQTTLMEEQKNVENVSDMVQLTKQPQYAMIQYKTVNIEVPISTCQYFRSITINNLTDQNIWIRILTDVDYIKTNALVPHLISKSVIANKNENILLYRLDPTKQIQDFQYKIQVQDSGKRKKKLIPPSFFKLYGQQNNQLVQMQIEQPVEPPMSIQNQEGNLKLCPICTFGNEPFAEKCQMCQSAFM